MLITVFILFVLCGCSDKTYTKPKCDIDATADFYIDDDKFSGDFIFNEDTFTFTVKQPQEIENITYLLKDGELLCNYDNIAFADTSSVVYKLYNALKILKNISAVTVPEYKDESGNIYTFLPDGTLVSVLFSSGESVYFS